jgi:hypothetical protein
MPFAGGADAMMSPEDCKKRSAECLTAAQRCSEDHGQQAWRQLSDLWVAWSDTLGMLSERERLASLRGMRSPFSYRGLRVAGHLSARHSIRCRGA